MKILLIGLGSIGQRHLRNLKKLYKQSEFFAYRTLKRDFILNNNNKITGDDIIKKYNIHQIYNFNEILKYNFDAVFINTPSSKHLDYFDLLLKKDFNIFIEKPLTDESSKARVFLKKISKYNNRKIMIGHQLRFNKCLLEIRNIIKKKIIGDICGANIYHGENIKNFHIYEDYKNIYAAKKSLGGGVILSQIHEIDYCCFLFGLPSAVYATGGKYSKLKIDVEDYVNILFKYKAKGGNKFSVNMTLDYLQNPKKRELFITGSKGSLKWDYYKDEIVLKFYNGKSKKISFKLKDRNDLFLREVKYFIERTKKNKLLQPSFIDGYNCLKITEMIKKSVEKEKLVKISYV